MINAEFIDDNDKYCIRIETGEHVTYRLLSSIINALAEISDYDICVRAYKNNGSISFWTAANPNGLPGRKYCNDCKYLDLAEEMDGIMYCKKYDVKAGLDSYHQVCVEHQKNFQDILENKKKQGWVIPEDE